MTLNKFKQKYMYNIFLVIIVIGFAVYYHLNQWNTYVECPYLTWGDQFFKIGIKHYEGTLKISDFFIPYAESGMLANHILFYFNLLFFHLSTKLDIIVNTILVIITAVQISLYYIKKCKANDISKTLGLIIINYIIFEVLQLSSGAMETQVRMGLTMCILWIFRIDSFCNKKQIRFWNYILVSLYTFLTINFFGTLYCFALLPVAVLFFVSKCIFAKKLHMRSGFVLLVLFLCCILYFFEYNLLGLGSSESSRGLLNNFIDFFVNFSNSFKGYLAYSGNSLIGYGAIIDGKISVNILLLVGMVIFIFALATIVWYFFSKQHNFISCGLVIYSVSVIIIVMIGRPFNWQWYYSEWYIVHSKFQLVGIFIMLFCDLHFEKKAIQNAIICLNTVVSILAFLLLFKGERIHIERQIYVKKYYQDMSEYFLIQDKEYMPVDDSGLTPVKMDLESTMIMNKYLKEKRLSMYYYTPITENYQNTLKKGCYEFDENGAAWLKKYSIFYIKTSQNKEQTLSLYINQTIEDNILIVKVNGENVYEKKLSEGKIEIPLVWTNEINCLEIITSKQIVPTGGDVRELGIMMIGIE